jgi:hypothetical protein
MVKLDLAMLALAAVIGVGILAAVYDERHHGSRLDRVQAKFEASPEGKGYNWPVFHQANSIAKLKCRDVSAALRVCDVAMPTIDPMTGQTDGWLHQPFACNATECGWLTE